MEVTVTKPIEDFIERQIAKGYGDASEVTRQAFLRWMDDEDVHPEPPQAREKIQDALNGSFQSHDPKKYDALIASIK